eukprot:scaffold119109_cov68-Phaeocystis_antarctica.AAC.8
MAPQRPVRRHVRLQHGVRADRWHVEGSAAVLPPPDELVRACVQPCARTEMRVPRLRVAVLDDTKKLAAVAATPRALKGAEFAVVVIASVYVEGRAVDGLRAPRLYCFDRQRLSWDRRPQL